VFVSGFPGIQRDKTEPLQRILTAGANWATVDAEFMVKDAFSLTNGYGLVYTNLSYRGMSGGPVLDNRGRVVGINAAAENEIELDREGEVVELGLGFSLGVPIRTLISLLDKTPIQSSWLQVETTPPPELTKTEIDDILDPLLTIRAPSQEANELDWLNYGNRLWRAFQYEQALMAFDKAIQVKPNFYLAYYAKGLTYAYTGKYQEAAADFEKATQLADNFYSAWRWLGNSFYLSQQYQKALPAYDKAIELQPDDANIYFNRAYTYAAIDEYEKAIVDYSKVIELSPGDAEAYFRRGDTYYSLREFQKAQENLQKAAQLYQEQGDTEGYQKTQDLLRELQQ
jgi:tetratricopeptide (TPR) repeat protein